MNPLHQAYGTDNLTMLTDFYELTMANGFLQNGLGNQIAYFDMFLRRRISHTCAAAGCSVRISSRISGTSALPATYGRCRKGRPSSRTSPSSPSGAR